VFLPYVGGLTNYMARCNEIASRDYEGFVLGATTADPVP
jgi:hypothetical protein